MSSSLALLRSSLDNENMTHQVKKNLGVALHGHSAEFRVWAPFAKSVSVAGNFAEGVFPMDSEGDGYWSKTLENVEAGHIYHYLIDTGTTTLVKNDPYARQLTVSDNGLSVIVAHDFDWGDDVFMPIPKEKQIIYEMHVGTFNRPDASTVGTFYDVIDRLDYLAELGVNMIQLMPITSMAFSNGWGYAPNYIFSIENNYGGRHGLMELVKAAHTKGIGVIVDVVYNHFYGDSDLWQFDGWNENGRGGIYFYNDQRGDTPWGGRPDYGRPEVRQFFLDNVVMWLNEYRLDGLRLDSTIYMRNTEGHDNDPAHDIADAWYLLGDIADLAHKVNPAATMIAEDCAATPYITKPTKYSGIGFDAQWELNFPHALRDALGLTYNVWPNLSALRYELTRGYNGNAFEKVIFSDSHDTAANGSVRLNEAASPGNAGSLFARQRALLANAITLTAPGMPMLLQGQEFMQEGAFNDWQMLEWDKADKFSGIVLAHQHLIDLRLNRHNSTAGLSGQSTSVFHQDDNNRILGYHRWSRGGKGDDVIVIANFSPDNHADYWVHLPIAGKWTCRFNSSWKGYSKDFHEYLIDTITTTDDGSTSLHLPPYSAMIFSQD